MLRGTGFELRLQGVTASKGQGSGFQSCSVAGSEIISKDEPQPLPTCEQSPMKRQLKSLFNPKPLRGTNIGALVITYTILGVHYNFCIMGPKTLV